MASAHRNTLSKLLLAWRILWRLAILYGVFLLLKRVAEQSGADLSAAFRTASPLPILAALLLYGFVQVLGAWRWRLLLTAQNVSLTLVSAFRLTLMANFFSQLIPGSVSGDALKIAIAAAEFTKQKAEITFTILLDRILGLSGLFLAAALTTCLSFGTVRTLATQHQALRYGLWAVNLGCLGTLVAAICFAFRPQLTALCRALRLTALWQRLVGLLPPRLRNFCGRLDRALEMYRPRQGILFAHLGVSTVIHLCCGLCLFLLGRGLHEASLTPLQYSVTMQVANASAIVPLAPGGLGLRDTITATFLQAFRISPPETAGTIPLAYSAVILAWALVGAAIFCLSPKIRNCKQG